MDDWPPLLRWAMGLGTVLGGALTVIFAAKNKSMEELPQERLRREVDQDLQKFGEALKTSIFTRLDSLEHEWQRRYESLAKDFHELSLDIAVLKDRDLRPTRRPRGDA